MMLMLMSDSTIKPKSGKRYGLWASKVYSNYDSDTNKSESVAVYIGRCISTCICRMM